MFKLNPSFGPGVAMDDVAQLVDRLNKDFEMLSFTDLVLNHAANESEWIASHPECVYNLVNAPHLKPAFILDRALVRFTKEIESGQWAHAGIPANIHTDEHLDAVRKVLEENVIPELRLWEFYQVTILCQVCVMSYQCCDAITFELFYNGTVVGATLCVPFLS
jgi:glycogen debranching enzyme